MLAVLLLSFFLYPGVGRKCKTCEKQCWRSGAEVVWASYMLVDPDQLVRGTDSDLDPFIIKQKQQEKP
jgi:hypothetical protein